MKPEQPISKTKVPERGFGRDFGFVFSSDLSKWHTSSRRVYDREYNRERRGK